MHAMSMLKVSKGIVAVEGNTTAEEPAIPSIIDGDTMGIKFLNPPTGRLLCPR